MKIEIILSLICLIAFCACIDRNAGAEKSSLAPEETTFNTLIWSSEFDQDGPLDSTQWFMQSFIPNGRGWFNNEVQHYTDRSDNAFVKDGHLHLVAKKEIYTAQGQTKQYTSARLNSKFAFTYGRVEVRAKLPGGKGVWPAIWTLGKNINEKGAYWQRQGHGTTGWPSCGEMDIMEHWGSKPNIIQSATHTPYKHGDQADLGNQIIPTALSDFHVYSLDWNKDYLSFGVDGKEHYRYHPKNKNARTWPYDHDHYLLLNIAILPIISDTFESCEMLVDYVRVYQ